MARGASFGRRLPLAAYPVFRFASPDLAALGATLTVYISDNVGQVTQVVPRFSPSLTPILCVLMPLHQH
jgi:hypothetical protein